MKKGLLQTYLSSKRVVQIDERLIHDLQPERESCTILHCRHKMIADELFSLTISPETFLIQDHGKHCKLIKAFNIDIYPTWTTFANQEATFSLVFEGLSKNSKTFHLMEQISQLPFFFSEDIQTNHSGVYTVELLSSEPF